MKKNLLLIVCVALMSLATQAQNTALSITERGSFFNNPDGVTFSENLISDLTYEAWVNVTDADSVVDYTAVIDARIGSSNSKAMIFKTFSTGLTVSFEYHGAWGYSDSAANVVTEGEWHHLALVISATDLKASFYIDGDLAGERAQGTGGDSDYGNIGAEVNWGDQIMVGSSNQMNERTFLGMIDEVRIWKTARTAEEIAANMASEIDETNPDLIAYYPCNDGFGSTNLEDATGNGYDLDINGGKTTGWEFVDESDWVVGINETTNTSTVSVYPNPVKSQLYLKGLGSLDAQAKIYDITGQLVMETFVKRSSMDVSSLSNGMYFVEIEQGANKYNAKFIKK